LNVDRVTGAFGDLGILGGDDGHAVADEMDVAIEDAIARIGGGALWKILDGQDGGDAGSGARGAGVDARNACMRVRRREHPRVEQAGQRDVICKRAAAGDQLDSIATALGAADRASLRHAAS
jgi:hypothetical protein